MDNYLTTLYYERFKITERERKLMENDTWPDDEDGHRRAIRNDQQITEVREQTKLMDRLITLYLEKLMHG